ncbi:MAG: P-II family nitrogen regulator [Actinobacteria bacterium]|nr:P-II family nitrogen regulator [Actinomycetota bacterium]
MDPGAGGGGGWTGVRLVTAVIPPSRLEQLQAAAAAGGATGMTVSDAGGYGRQRGHSATWMGAEYQIDFVPKLQVELLVSAADADRVVDALVAFVRTGRIGDGKVWVTPVESVTRIRTGEAGLDAL